MVKMKNGPGARHLLSGILLFDNNATYSDLERWYNNEQPDTTRDTRLCDFKTAYSHCMKQRLVYRNGSTVGTTAYGIRHLRQVTEQVNALPKFGLVREMPARFMYQPSKVLVAQHSSQLDTWVDTYCTNTEGVLGLDCEWYPVPPRRRGDPPIPADLVQIATREGYVLLAPLAHLTPTRNGSFLRLLENASVLKAGMAIKGDVDALHRRGISVRGARDCVLLAQQFGQAHARNIGLKTVATGLFGGAVVQYKDPHIARSNWARRPLSQSQQKYAASDALLSLAIYEELLTRLQAREGGGQQQQSATMLFLQQQAGNVRFCDVCNMGVHSESAWESHTGGRRHHTRVLRASIQTNLPHFVANKNGMVISPLDLPASVEPGQVVRQAVTVTNTSRDSDVVFHGCQQLVARGEVSVTDRYGVCEGMLDELVIPPQHRMCVELSVRPTRIGVLLSLLVFDFGSFKIGRKVRLVVLPSGEDVALVKSTGAYVRPPPRRLERAGPPPIDGVRPGNFSGVTWVMDKLYDRRSREWTGQGRELARLTRRELALEWGHYGPRLLALLQLEADQELLDIQSFDLEGATLTNGGGGFLKLRVEGLCEKRPSVLKGDKVIVTRGGGKRYNGYAHQVMQTELLLKFHPSFHSSYVTGERVDVRFTVNQSCLRRARHALARYPTLPQQLLFPTLEPAGEGGRGGAGSTNPRQLRFRNRSLNAVQQQAVAEVVLGGGGRGDAPYVIFGPPGTGKTTTIVEAVYQLALRPPPLSSSSSSQPPVGPGRILLCAPSNSAADLLADRLRTALNPSELLRVNALTRSLKDIPVGLLPYCCTAPLRGGGEGDLQQEQEQERRLQSVRVLVCTCMSAVWVVKERDLRFSHVFLDEAGHATEPEALVALAGLVGRGGGGGRTDVVLAGDPLQLGPIVRSGAAKEGGLGVSFLERLVSSSDLYRRYGLEEEEEEEEEEHEEWGGDGDGRARERERERERALGRQFASTCGHNPRFLTKLVVNYRSHPDLLSLPNRLFYHNDLVARGDAAVTHSLLHWQGPYNEQQQQQRPKCPLIFHGVAGADERERNSPSWFNVQELLVAKEYLLKLRDDSRRLGIGLHDIGVIAPYHKQVVKFRTLLRSNGMAEVKVGSVEEFQGQERRVIVVSTVRSNPDLALAQFDQRHHLGFLGMPKRFNVTTTRAQALMIVIGNPVVLRRDPNWSALLTLCVSKGAYVGEPLSDTDAETDGLSERLAALGINTEEDITAGSVTDEGGAGVSEMAAQEVPAFDIGQRL